MNKLLNSNEYDFLKEGKMKDKKICLLVNKSIDDCGLDGNKTPLRGFYLDPKENTTRAKTFINSKYNCIIYSIEEVKEKLINCDPLALEMLLCDFDNILMITDEGKVLKENINLFLNACNIEKSFEDYIAKIEKELITLLARNNFYSQDDKEEILLNNMYEKTCNNDVQLEIIRNENGHRKIMTNINIKNIEFKELRKIINEMGNELDCFNFMTNEINKENKIHDKILKQTIQIIKTYSMGIYILSGYKYNKYGEDKYLTLDILNNKYDYNELLDIIERFKNNFKYALKNTDIPYSIEYDKLNNFINELSL